MRAAPVIGCSICRLQRVAMYGLGGSSFVGVGAARYR